jgi:hypothetical protein
MMMLFFFIDHPQVTNDAQSNGGIVRFLALPSPSGLGLRIFGCLLMVANLAAFALLLTLARRRRTAIDEVVANKNKDHAPDSALMRGDNPLETPRLGQRDFSALNEDDSSSSVPRRPSTTTSVVVTLDSSTAAGSTTAGSVIPPEEEDNARSLEEGTAAAWLGGGRRSKPSGISRSP